MTITEAKRLYNIHTNSGIPELAAWLAERIAHPDARAAASRVRHKVGTGFEAREFHKTSVQAQSDWCFDMAYSHVNLGKPEHVSRNEWKAMGWILALDVAPPREREYVFAKFVECLVEMDVDE